MRCSDFLIKRNCGKLSPFIFSKINQYHLTIQWASNSSMRSNDKYRNSKKDAEDNEAEGNRRHMYSQNNHRIKETSSYSNKDSNSGRSNNKANVNNRVGELSFKLKPLENSKDSEPKMILSSATKDHVLNPSRISKKMVIGDKMVTVVDKSALLARDRMLSRLKLVNDENDKSNKSMILTYPGQEGVSTQENLIHPPQPGTSHIEGAVKGNNINNADKKSFSPEELEMASMLPALWAIKKVFHVQPVKNASIKWHDVERRHNILYDYIMKRDFDLVNESRLLQKVVNTLVNEEKW